MVSSPRSFAPTAGPGFQTDQDPRAISVAVAVAKAAARAIHSPTFSGNARYNSALAALGDTMLLDEYKQNFVSIWIAS